MTNEERSSQYLKSGIVQAFKVYCNRPHTTVKNARNMKSVFQRVFQTLNARAARTTLFSNIHLFCIPKSSCFMNETAVKRISFFLESLMLYEVYNSLNRNEEIDAYRSVKFPIHLQIESIT